MNLLPNDLLRKLEAQDPYSKTGPGRELAPEEELVLAKWTIPGKRWAWYAVSASPEPEADDVQFFGLVDGLELEAGYFWLSQLKEASDIAGITVELDDTWEPIPLMRLMEELERAAVN